MRNKIISNGIEQKYGVSFEEPNSFRLIHGRMFSDRTGKETFSGLLLSGLAFLV